MVGSDPHRFVTTKKSKAVRLGSEEDVDLGPASPVAALGAKLVASGRTIRPLMVDVDKYTVPAGMRIGSEALVRHIMIQHQRYAPSG